MFNTDNSAQLIPPPLSNTNQNPAHKKTCAKYFKRYSHLFYP